MRVGGLTDAQARQLPVIVDGATLRAFGSSTWTTDAGPVDVLRDLPVAGRNRVFDELVRRSTAVEVNGVVIRLAALDDIIDSKSHADRPKDREALAELRRLRTEPPPNS